MEWPTNNEFVFETALFVRTVPNARWTPSMYSHIWPVIRSITAATCCHWCGAIKPAAVVTLCSPLPSAVDNFNEPSELSHSEYVRVARVPPPL